MCIEILSNVKFSEDSGWMTMSNVAILLPIAKLSHFKNTFKNYVHLKSMKFIVTTLLPLKYWLEKQEDHRPKRKKRPGKLTNGTLTSL